MTLRAVTWAVIDGKGQVTPFFAILLGDIVCFDLLSQPVQRMGGLVGWFIAQQVCCCIKVDLFEKKFDEVGLA